MTNHFRGKIENPFIIALILLLCVVIGTASVFYPIVFIGFIILGFSCWMIDRTLRYPVMVFAIAMWTMPWSSFVRTVGGVYAPSVPLFVERFSLEIMLAIAGGSLVIRKIVHGRQSQIGMRLSWDDISVHMLMLAAIYGLMLTLVESKFTAALFGIKVSVTPLLCYYLLRSLKVDRAQINGILVAFAMGYMLIAVVSFYDYFVHPHILFELGLHARGMLDNDASKIAKMRVFVTTAYFRMQSLMYEEDFWGCASGFLSTYALARLVEGKAPKYLYFLAPIATLGLLLSMARGAIVGWVVGVFVLILVYRGRRIRIVLLLSTACLVVGSIYMQQRSDARIQYIESRAAIFAAKESDTSNGSGSASATKPNTFDGRTTQWSNAFQAIINQPSGFGLGTDGLAAEYDQNGARMVTDGGYLRVGVEQGYFGFVLVIAGMIAVPITILRRLRGVTDTLARSLGACLIAQTMSLFVQAVPGNAFDYPYTPHIYFILFAIFMELTSTRGRAEKAMFEGEGAPDPLAIAGSKSLSITA